MKITFLNSYPSKNGKIMHRYAVSGTESELARYEAIKGEYFRVDENTGKPVYTTSNATLGKSAELKFRYDGTDVYAVNPQVQTLQGVTQQFAGSALGDAICQQAAQAIIQMAIGTQTVVAQQQMVSTPVAAVPAPVEDDSNPFEE